jgi:YidC/Oxa1 family membrane protein insertase
LAAEKKFMEKRVLIALLISFIVFIGFGYVQQKYLPHPPPVPKPNEEQQAAAKKLPSPEPVKPAVSPPVAPPAVGHQAQDVIVETPLYRAVFTEQGARVKSFRLKKFWDRLPFQKIADFSLWMFNIDIQKYRPLGEITDPKELIRSNTPEMLPLGMTWQAATGAIGPEEIYRADKKEITLTDGGEARLTFTTVRADGVRLVRTFTFKGDSYRLDMATAVQNKGTQPLQGNLGLTLYDDFSHVEGTGFTGFAWSAKRSREEIASKKLKEPKTIADFEWAALETGYFMMALVPPPAELKTSAVIQDLPPQMMSATFKTEVASVPPGQEVVVPYILYLGPKNRAILASVGFGLERAVDFGWFHVLALPLLYVLQFFYKYLHNYGLAIIAITFIIRVLFIYPNHKSFKSMQDMQKLQPKIAKLREKYKDDREALNKELMGLYRTYKVNPMGGCLPMVLQLPVFIALYNILGYSIELRNAPFISTLPFTNIVWLADLSAKDPLLITPLIMGATMFLQQKMTPSPGDPAQAKMMLFMPIIFTFMFLNFASGLVLYWLFNNILSIGQQYYTNKYMS